MRPNYAVAATAIGAVLMAGNALAQQTSEPRTQNGQRTQSGAPARTTNGRTASINCPEGCVPARPPLTAEQRRRRAEAVRAAREAAEQDRLAREQAERDRMARLSAAEAAALDAQRRAQAGASELDRLRSQQAQAAQALAQERAERERLANELAERERLAAYQRERRRVIARGGGPMSYRPMFTMAVEGGVGGFTGWSIDRATYAGGVWGARLGVDFFNWLGVEARYFGQATALNPVVAGSVGNTITNGGSGTLRLTAPIPYVQPYGFVGVGGYNTQVNRTNTSQLPGLVSASYLVIPVGLGVNVPIGRFFSVGAEGTYHAIPSLDHLVGSVWESAQNWSGTGVLRVRL